MKAPIPFCNFCGKSRNAVKILIGGKKGGTICDGCVELAVDRVDKEREQRRARKTEATKERSTSR